MDMLIATTPFSAHIPTKVVQLCCRCLIFSIAGYRHASFSHKLKKFKLIKQYSPPMFNISISFLLIKVKKMHRDGKKGKHAFRMEMTHFINCVSYQLTLCNHHLFLLFLAYQNRREKHFDFDKSC